MRGDNTTGSKFFSKRVSRPTCYNEQIASVGCNALWDCTACEWAARIRGPQSVSQSGFSSTASQVKTDDEFAGTRRGETFHLAGGAMPKRNAPYARLGAP